MKARREGKISEQTIAKIREEANILDVVGEFYTLKKSGSEYKMLSPKTGEKTASFYVVPQKNFFKDFSTGEKGGDAIRFLMDYQGMTFVNALTFLANKYGIPIERDDFKPKFIPAKEQDETALKLFTLNKWMTTQFEDSLWNNGNGSTALDYLIIRGVQEEHIKNFKLGYAPASYDFLKNKARKQFNEPYELLINASIVKRHQDGNHFYDVFRDRVMFPIMDAEGRTIAFGGRLITEIPPNTPAEKRPAKYINSHESLIFKKGSSFFGLYQAIPHIRKANAVYIVEGYMDVLAFVVAGIPNVVSLNGTSMNENAIKILSRYTRNFIITMDGDVAGKKAVHYQLPILLKASTVDHGSVKIVTLPDKQDPNEYLNQHGAEKFRAFIKNNERAFIMELILNHWKEETSPEKAGKIIKSLIQSICYIEDRVLRSQHLRLLSNLTQVPIEVITQEELIIEEKRQKILEMVNSKITRAGTMKYSPTRTLLKIMLKFGEDELDGKSTVTEYVINQLILNEVQLPDSMDNKVINTIAVILKRKFTPSVDNIGKLYPELRTYINQLKEEKMKDNEMSFSRTSNPELDKILNAIRVEILQGKIEQATAASDKSRYLTLLKTYPQFN